MAARNSEPVSIREAARRLGVKPKEIRRRIKNGDLEGFVVLPAGYAQYAASQSGGTPRTPALVGTAQPSLQDAASDDDDDDEDESDTPSVVPRGTPSQPAAALKDAEIGRLHSIVAILQGELEAQRREMHELVALLRQQRDVTDATAAQPNQIASERNLPAPPAPLTLPEPGPPPDEPDVDWQAYDADSEQLRSTMNRLQSLLDELEGAGEDEAFKGNGSTSELIPDASPALAPQNLATSVGAVTPPRASRSPRPASAASLSTSSPSSAPAVNHAGALPVTAGTPTAGAALAKRRESLNISREQLAAASGLTWGFVTEVERGRRRDARSVQRVAEALEAVLLQRKQADER